MNAGSTFLQCSVNRNAMKHIGKKAWGILVDRFMSVMMNIPYPTDDKCWEWPNVKSYGVLSTRGTRIGAHVLSFRLFSGQVPHGMFVCHKCDNPPCCRPDHLFLGTCSDNSLDALAKGRISIQQLRRASLAGGRTRRKLTDAQVKEARRLHATGWGIRSLERKYKISHRPMWLIIHGETYK